MTRYSDLSKGPAWEYRVMRALYLSGWYVRRGINLRERVRASPQTMAEIDILGLGFDPSLTPRMLTGECKDRKGSTKEADRIVWVLGLSRLLRVDHVLFAKRSLSDATLQFAQPMGVVLWDQAALLDIEQRYGFTPDEPYFGSANVSLQEDVLRPLRKASALRHRPLRSAWEYLSGAFWYQPSPARTKSLAGYFEALVAARSLSREARSSFVAEGLLALLASAYSTAGQMARHSPARGEQLQEVAFASGVADAAALREIAARADDYYQDALQRSRNAPGGAATQVSVPRLANAIAQAPGWMASYIALARRLGEVPLLAGDTMRYADLVVFEQLAGNPVHDLVPLMVSSEHERLHANVQLAALFLQRVWGIQDPILDRLMTPSAVKKPRTRCGVVAEKTAAEKRADTSLFDPAL